MADPKPVTITNRQGKQQQVTPGKGYAYTKPDGTRGYIVYDDKGGGQFTAYPNKPASPSPVTITNRQGKQQQVTPGKGYAYTKPDGTRGYIVYDDKGGGQFTAYPNKPASTPPASTAPAATPPASTRPSGTPSRQSPPVAPAPATRPAQAPQASPVVKYMDAAAAARKIQDPVQRAAQMAKVRDMGMEIWKAKYKDTLAKPKTPEQKFNPLMQKTFEYQTGNAPDQIKAASAGANPEKEKAAFDKSRETANKMGLSRTLQNLAGPEAAKNLKLKNSYEYDSFNVVLEYLLSQGHVETLDEALYVMMEMDGENIINIIQERAWWDPAGVFMSKREKQIEKAKSTPTAFGASYRPETGRTYNPAAKDQTNPTGVIAGRGGVIGIMKPGKPETWERYPAGSDFNPNTRRQNIDRYVTLRGPEQLRIDAERNLEAKRKAAADAAFDKKYGVNQPPADEFAGVRNRTTSTNPPRGPVTDGSKPTTRVRPPVISPKPQPATIQSKNVTSTGTSYERRTPTSAEMAAAKKAGGGEAGIKAAVDIAKSNQVAASSPTPLLKPEEPKKRESLVSQAKELKATRERIEKEGIKPIKMESYDIVLEYLFSQGHVETLDEALYVMMQMDAECIHSIVENVQGSPVKLKPKSGLGGGVPVYEKGQEPKPPSGVQLPKLPPV